MRTYILIILLLASVSLLYPNTYTINHDGTGDFTTITEGIDAAWHGDTLLVYPGRYVENIRYNGKNITITSLYGVETDDRNIIKETVIDGNQDGAVVTFRDSETRDAVLNGFTITNGSGYRRGYDTKGGGINIRGASPIISNNIIEYNIADAGGGLIHHRDGSALLTGNIIRYNSSFLGSGGVSGYEIEFCPESPNSIYHNYAGQRSNDLAVDSLPQQEIILDAFTVAYPQEYDQEYEEYFMYIPEDLTLTIHNSKIEPVAADLYVSTDGCNTNSGLTPEEPLQTIALAVAMIEPESEMRHNIYVSDGVYSRSLNNQFFPIQIRSNINIIGESREYTILDIEHNANAGGFGSLILLQPGEYSGPAQRYKSNFSIRNFSIINGGYKYERHTVSAPGIMLYSAQEFEIKNVGIYNGRVNNRLWGPFYGSFVSHFLIKDLDIANNIGGIGLDYTIAGGGTHEALHGKFENIRINNQTFAPVETNLIPDGNSFGLRDETYVGKPIDISIANLEITEGKIGNITPDWNIISQSPFTVSFRRDDFERNIKLVNATIANNHVDWDLSGSVTIIGHLNFEIINSIIHGNRPYNYFIIGSIIGSPNRNPITNFKVSNTLFEGGREGIKCFADREENVNVTWGEGNIDADPLWVGEDLNPDYPYMLHPDSPARNAGTLDIPDFEFPEYDLAGNPRVVDGQIDMGAYQWQPSEWRKRVKRREAADERYEEEYNLRNFPNPAVSLGRIPSTRSGASGGERASTGTTISFEAPEAGNVVIEIYNLKGQFVSRVFNADVSPGEYNVYWDGRDERNRPVATGFYMYHLKFNDQLVATGRCTFIK